jgi:hypothetical protein
MGMSHIDLDYDELKLLISLLSPDEAMEKGLIDKFDGEISQISAWRLEAARRDKLHPLLLAEIEALKCRCLATLWGNCDKKYGHFYKEHPELISYRTWNGLKTQIGNGGYTIGPDYIQSELPEKHETWYVPSDCVGECRHDYGYSSGYMLDQAIFASRDDAVRLAQSTMSKKISTVEVYESKTLRTRCSFKEDRKEDRHNIMSIVDLWLLQTWIAGWAATMASFRLHPQLWADDMSVFDMPLAPFIIGTLAMACLIAIADQMPYDDKKEIV